MSFYLYFYLCFRSLCDTCQTGKLNKEQFALAMWLIKQKLRGIDPPASLTPDMIPPSMRKPSDTIVVCIYFCLTNFYLLI